MTRRLSHQSKSQLHLRQSRHGRQKNQRSSRGLDRRPVCRDMPCPLSVSHAPLEHILEAGAHAAMATVMLRMAVKDSLIRIKRT